MFSTRLHSATIRDVVAGSAARLSLTSFVPPKTQSFARGIAYMSGASSQTIAAERPSILRHDCDLTTMWLEIGVIHKLARADSCAVDHEVELCIDIFEFFEADVRVDFPAKPYQSARSGNRDKS